MNSVDKSIILSGYESAPFLRQRVDETPEKNKISSTLHLGGLLPEFRMLIRRRENVKKEQVEAKPKPEKKQPITVNVENKSYHHQQKMKPATVKLENVPYPLLNKVFPPSPRQALSTIQSMGLKQQAAKLQQVPCKPIKRHRKVPANNKKNKFGKINSGVGHGIRKPKKTKPVSNSIKQQLIERFSRKWKKKTEEPSETANDFEAIWNSEESEGNSLQEKVANIVEHLEIDEPEEIVTSDEQLDKIAQLMKTIHNMQDSPMKEDDSPLDAEKVKEVDELLDILLGTSPLPADCELHQATSDTKKFPLNNIMELPTTSSSGSDCEALEPPTQEEAEKLRQMEELMSQLDHSSYTDPDDTDPFADDDDESIVTSTSNEISQGTSTNSELPMIIELYTDTTQVDKFSPESQETGSSNVPSTVDSNEMEVCDSTETSAKDTDSELESSSKNMDRKTLVVEEIETDVNMVNEQCEISNKESDSMDVNEENTECPQNDKFSKLDPTKEVELQKTTEGLTKTNLSTDTPESSDENTAPDQTVTEQMETSSKLESNPSAGETISACDLPAKLGTPKLSQAEPQSEYHTPENSIKVCRESAYFTAQNKDLNYESSNDSFFSAESSPIVSSKLPTPKLFSIFMKGSPSSSSKSNSPLSGKQQRLLLPAKDHGSKEQLLLDAGQKKFGVDSCMECGFVFDPDCRSDVTTHLAFHNRHETQLKHLGWKNERVLVDFKNGDRIIMVQPGDPTAWWRRVATILETVNNDLGFIEDIIDFKNIKYNVFMYIHNKSVVSCVVAESISVANKLLPGHEALCSTEFFPATCGITRIWTSKLHRRKGYAAKLMDVLRENFLSHRDLKLTDIAFSSPSLSGREFAAKYLGTPTFLVYT